MTEPSLGSSFPEEREDAATKEALGETPRASSRSELHRAIVLIQHQLNNPLAALLAEAQLLGLESTLGTEQRAAATRITELARRVIAQVRDLDRLVDDPNAEADGRTNPADRTGNDDGG